MDKRADPRPSKPTEHVTSSTSRLSREDRDELALILYSRMIFRRPVWVDSPMGQMRWIQMIGLDEDGEVVAYDSDGQDRLPEAYLLTSPGRPES